MKQSITGDRLMQVSRPSPARHAGRLHPSCRVSIPVIPTALAFCLTIAAPSAAVADNSRPSGTPKSPEEYDAPVPAWREGPVRYILNAEEDRTYRATRKMSVEKRARFIREFWVSRDLDRTAPGNEYRDLYYRRVAEADRMFTESTAPGWKTDRGKIHILLGPPDEVEWISSLQSERHSVLWTYRKSPALVGLGPNPTLRFVKDRTGEYRLTNDYPLSGLETSLSVAFESQALQMTGVSSPQHPPDAALGSNPRGDSPFHTHRDFFQSSGGKTLTLLTVGIDETLLDETDPSGESSTGVDQGGEELLQPPPGADASPSGSRFDIGVRLVGEEPDQPAYDLSGPGGLRGPARGAGERVGRYFLYQGGTSVIPGRYAAHFDLIDRSTGRPYSFVETIDVPDFKSDSLSLSSITLASRLERLDEGIAGYSAPFVLGNLRILPRPDDIFHADEDLAFYFHVYGTTIDPIGGRPDLDVEYRFFISGEGPTVAGPVFSPLGHPILLTGLQTPIQGFSLPLLGWDSGRYRVRVLVTDRLTGERASRDVTFRID